VSIGFVIEPVVLLGRRRELVPESMALVIERVEHFAESMGL
jgi:hypothetical protein